MSQTATRPRPAEADSLERLCTTIRGKLQFMDYLVRAASADVERFRNETDPGTQIFLRQIVEMHASNLADECEDMRMVGEFCGSLDEAVSGVPATADRPPTNPFRDGDSA